MSKPKAVLFDIGGVCVVSPFQAIVDYEAQFNVPKDYINFAISRSAPNGAWQRLERGEIKMDEAFFTAFQQDLNNSKHWEQYHLYFKNRDRKKNSLKELASANATQLGDPVSLKAETSSTIPTPDEAGAPPPAKPKRRSFKDVASKAMLGDPVSLKAEKTDKSPMPDDSGAPPAQRDGGSSKSEAGSSKIPPMLKIDSTTLFWNMMARIREPDPNVFPALLALRESKQFLVAALSNTVVFPADHELSKAGSRDIQSHFDVFVSSSEIGLRKPDPRIYRLAIEKLDEFDKARGGDGVRADQVVFLDDIGENLKPARDLGIQTIKVNLGRTNEAVEQLEKVVGMKLAGGSKSRL